MSIGPSVSKQQCHSHETGKKPGLAFREERERERSEFELLISELSSSPSSSSNVIGISQDIFFHDFY